VEGGTVRQGFANVTGNLPGYHICHNETDSTTWLAHLDARDGDAYNHDNKPGARGEVMHLSNNAKDAGGAPFGL
jgi:hypothetical protein